MIKERDVFNICMAKLLLLLLKILRVVVFG